MPSSTISKDIGYRRLWRDWIAPYNKLILSSFLLMIITALASAGYSKIIQLILNAYDAADASVIYWGPAGIIGIALAKGISAFFQSVATSKSLFGFQADLQKEMYSALIEADLSRLQDDTPAGLATRFSADISILHNSMSSLLNGVGAILIIVATLGVMLTIDWQITLVLMVIFLAAASPVNGIGKKVRRISKGTQAELSTMNSEVTEGLANIRMARTYQLEDHLKSNAKNVFDRIKKLRITDMKWKARLSPIMEVVSGSAVAALLIVVSWRISNGTITVADFMGLLTGVGVLSSPARRIGATYTAAMQGRAALDRIFQILDAKNEIVDRPDAYNLDQATGHVKFDGVGFMYPNGFEALKNVSIDVPPGTKVALVGPSGAGKSTVFNLIPRLFDATSGQVSIDGHNIRDISVSSLRSQIAVVSQDSVLLTGTIAENIRFGRLDATNDEVENAARSAASDEFINRLPEKFETMVSPASNRFSGGEKQRLSIARAMLRDAAILLLDEPTSALDAESEAVIKRALDELAHGRTTFVIAHRLSTILDADMIIVMDQGSVVETGTHEELLEKGGLYSELYHLQFAHI